MSQTFKKIEAAINNAELQEHLPSIIARTQKSKKVSMEDILLIERLSPGIILDNNIDVSDKEVTLETLSHIQKVGLGGLLLLIIGYIVKMFGGGSGSGGGGGGSSGGAGITKTVKEVAKASDALKDTAGNASEALRHARNNTDIDETATELINEVDEESRDKQLRHEEIIREIDRLMGDRGEKLLQKIVRTFAKHVNKTFLLSADSDEYKNASQFMKAVCNSMSHDTYALSQAGAIASDAIVEFVNHHGIDAILSGKESIPYTFSFSPDPDILNAINAFDGGEAKSHWLDKDILQLAHNSRDKFRALHVKIKNTLPFEVIYEKKELVDDSDANCLNLWGGIYTTDIVKLKDEMHKLESMLQRAVERMQKGDNITQQLKAANYSHPDLQRMQNDYKALEKLYGRVMGLFSVICNELDNTYHHYNALLKRLNKVERIVHKLYVKLSNE